jgi:folate-binding protein YgfZ
MIHQAWQSFLERTSNASADGVSAGAATGLAWLPDYAVVSFEGTDVLRFLQGYLTCDTAALTPTQLQPAAFCSLKGRVVLNGWCTAPGPEQVLLVTHRSVVEILANLLKVYLRFSKTRLVDLRDERLVFGGLHAGAGGLPLDAARELLVCASIAEAEALWQAHAHIAAANWDAAMIAAGLPLVSAPTSDAFLPQMLNLPAQGAIDFAKGCYLGQEVVARAQHRGQVKRHLARLAWRGAEMPAAGAELADAEGRARAVVIQSAPEPTTAQAGTCLAVVQDETAFPLSLGATELTETSPSDPA